MSDVYLWGLSRYEAADIVGLTETQLKNYQQRYGIFPEDDEKRGLATTFDFRKIMKLAVFCQMLDDGFSAPAAADAVSPYSVYASLFNEATDFAHYPGVFFVSKNHEGRWVGKDGPNVASRYEVRTWILFDRLWPKFEAAVLSADWERTPVEYRRQALTEYAAKMAEWRKKLWS